MCSSRSLRRAPLPRLDRLIAAAERHDRRVRVGFNHRYHPAFREARQLVDRGALGPLMFVRGRYGHGGRVGYDREWRADPAKAGGGELIDQGVHLIDLAGWFLGSFTDVHGVATTYFWDMPVDDNAFMTLRTATGTDGLSARELHGMEEPLLLRDLRPQRQDRDRRPGRELRRRTTGVLPDAAGDGTARDDDSRVPRRGPLVGDRVRRVPRRHPPWARAFGRS